MDILPKGLPLQRCCPNQRLKMRLFIVRRRFMVYEQVFVSTQAWRAVCCSCGMRLPTRAGFCEVEFKTTAEQIENGDAPWLTEASFL